MKNRRAMVPGRLDCGPEEGHVELYKKGTCLVKLGQNDLITKFISIKFFL